MRNQGRQGGRGAGLNGLIRLVHQARSKRQPATQARIIFNKLRTQTDATKATVYLICRDIDKGHKRRPAGHNLNASSSELEYTLG